MFESTKVNLISCFGIQICLKSDWAWDTKTERERVVEWFLPWNVNRKLRNRRYRLIYQFVWIDSRMERLCAMTVDAHTEHTSASSSLLCIDIPLERLTSEASIILGARKSLPEWTPLLSSIAFISAPINESYSELLISSPWRCLKTLTKPRSTKSSETFWPEGNKRIVAHSRASKSPSAGLM